MKSEEAFGQIAVLFIDPQLNYTKFRENFGLISKLFKSAQSILSLNLDLRVLDHAYVSKLLKR